MLDRRLEGGARLVVVPVERGPVAIQLWILRGTASEGPREHGCAHLLEHMLFKPTTGHAAGEEFDIATAIETLAGDVNAFTSHDETVFHATVPSDAVDGAMRAMLGAVVHPRLDPEELRREAKVVVQEIRQSDDDPGGRVGQDLLELIYRGHDYGRPVLGRKREVQSHDVARLLRVHRALFAADQAALVVVGPVRPKAVERTAAKILRELPRRARRSRIPIPKLPTSPRIKVAAAKVHEAHLAVGWAAPALHVGSGLAETEAACALEVASVVLGYGEASRLSERVRRNAQLVTDAYASFYAMRCSSALLVTVQTPAERVTEAADALLREVEALRRIPISPVELQRAQAVVRSEVVYRQETVQGRAHALGYQLSLSGDIDGERRYFEAIEALTPDAVLRACAKYLAPQRTCVTAVVPRGRARHDARLRKTLSARLRRRGGRSKPRKFKVRPGIVAVDFPCGFRLRVREEASVPMATGWMVWSGGLRAERTRDVGSSAMMAALLTRGSASTSGDALAQEIDGLAAVLEGFSGRNSVGVHFECPVAGPGRRDAARRRVRGAAALRRRRARGGAADRPRGAGRRARRHGGSGLRGGLSAAVSRASVSPAPAGDADELAGHDGGAPADAVGGAVPAGSRHPRAGRRRGRERGGRPARVHAARGAEQDPGAVDGGTADVPQAGGRARTNRRGAGAGARGPRPIRA